MQYRVTESDRQRIIKRLGHDKALSVIVALEYERLTQQQQAEIVGISRMTLYRWRQEPSWIAEYDRVHKKKVQYIKRYFRACNRNRFSVRDLLDGKSLYSRMLLG